MSNGLLATIDSRIIGFTRKAFLPSARFALFIIFAWFGSLKVFGLSPATPLVTALHAQTVPFIGINEFLMILGIYEVLIGLTFIIKGFERTAIALLLPHMFATMLPLILLPEYTWSNWFIPTLEGQYIIKNLALIAAAIGIAAQLSPLRKPKVKKEEDEKGKKK